MPDDAKNRLIMGDALNGRPRRFIEGTNDVRVCTDNVWLLLVDVLYHLPFSILALSPH